MKFLREFDESLTVKVLTESTATGKDLYIEGIFAQAEKKNRNGRIYPRSVMSEGVSKYNTDYVAKNRALGELEHPPRPKVDSKLASHRITEFKMKGDDVYGKALILDTPQGQILRGLLKGGTQLGVSTRALGSIKEESGTVIVQPDFQLFAVDAVLDPSGIDCFVDAVNESSDWIVTDDGRILEKMQAEVKKGKINEEKAIEMFSKFLQEISVR